MNNFLDKVGLQHVIEKIKSLLSGYLPLEKGGTIGTGAPTTTLKAGNITLEGVGGNAPNPGTSIKKKVEISEKSITCTRSDETNPTFQINDSGITAKKFVLSGNSSSEGLIANNSETVIPEIDDEQTVRLFYTHSIPSNDYKYVGAHTLGVLYSLIDVNTSQMSVTVTQDVIASYYFKSIAAASMINIKITKNTTCHFHRDMLLINPEYIKTLVIKGPLLYNLEGSSNLETFRSNASYTLSPNLFQNAFKNCTKLTYVDVNDWNIDEANSLCSSFYNCSALSNITLNNWDTRNVTDTSTMFAQCSSLENLDITGWDMTNVTNMTDMFAGCSKIKNLLLSEGFGRMKDEVGTLDLSSLTNWTNESVQTLLTLYDRNANGLGVITIKLSAATKNALGTSGIQTLTAKGYTIA